MKFRAVPFLLTLFINGYLNFIPAYAGVNPFVSDAAYEVYFTPEHNCTHQIVRTIQKAKHSIYVQAYFLTAEPILYALVDAKARDVTIQVIIDKNHPENQKGITKMLEMGIPVWIDRSSGIAHNKVMIIDESTVITGSFNFTYSANHRNRENLLFIHDRHLAKRYLTNWYWCQARSTQEVPLAEKTQQRAVNRPLSMIDKLIDEMVRCVHTMLEMVSVVWATLSDSA